MVQNSAPARGIDVGVGLGETPLHAPWVAEVALAFAVFKVPWFHLDHCTQLPCPLAQAAAIVGAEHQVEARRPGGWPIGQDKVAAAIGHLDAMLKDYEAFAKAERGYQPIRRLGNVGVADYRYYGGRHH